MNGKAQAISKSSPDVFEHSEKVYKNSVYKISPLNALVTHGDSADYRITIIADEMPSIIVAEKPDSVSMKALYFNGKIQDDHGFSSLIFHYKTGIQGDKSSEHEFAKQVKADLSQTQADFFYFWNLKELGPKPGEQVTYFLK